MTTKNTNKFKRADARLARLTAHLESKLEHEDEAIQAEAAARLTEIVLEQHRLKDRREDRLDRAADRAFRLQLAGIADAPTTPAEALALVESLKRQAGGAHA
jgi:hypothetical protein